MLSRRCVLSPKFHFLKGASIPTLKNLCVRTFGDNLLLFEGFDEVPVQIRAKVYNYLVETKTLSHRKLALLVAEDQLRIDLSLCPYSHDHYLQVLQKPKMLSRLSLAGCRNMTDEGLQNIAACGRLTDLNVSGTKLTSSALAKIVQACPNLVKVNLSETKINTGLNSLARRCNKLTFLWANDCYDLDHVDAIQVLNYAGPWLQTFEIRDCGRNKFHLPETRNNRWNMPDPIRVQSFAFEYTPLKQPLKSLVSLDVSGCIFVQDDFALKFFNTTLPSLQKLSYKGSSLSTRGIMHILARCPGMRNFSATLWDRKNRDEQMVNFDQFLAMAVKAGRLTTASIGELSLLTLPRLQPIASLNTLQRLTLKRIDPELDIVTLVEMLAPMSLRFLRLEDIQVAPGKRQLPPLLRGFKSLETLEIVDIQKLADEHLESAGLLNMFELITNFRLIGRTLITGAGLLLLINTLTQLTSLTIDHLTHIAHPLSILLDDQHAAPICQVHLPHYDLGNLFTEKSLDSILDESRTPNTHIRLLDLKKSPKTAQIGTLYNLIFQAMFFLLPFLGELDMTHQFSRQNGQYLAIDLPNNNLKILRGCWRHDNVHLGNVHPNCNYLKPDCSPEFPTQRGELFDLDSSSEDLDFAALFD